MEGASTSSEQRSSGEDLAPPTGVSTPARPRIGVAVQTHLWVEDAGARASSESEDGGVPPAAVAMVADLLQVRGGDLREPSGGSIEASFADAALAVSAARNVQRLVLGFWRGWQGKVLQGCTVVTLAEEAAGELDGAPWRDLPALKQLPPGQVLVAGKLCDSARSIPGLEFQAMGVAALGRNDEGRQVLQLLPPRHMEGYIEEPYEPKVVPRDTQAVALPMAKPVEPVTPRPPAYVLVSSPATGRSPVAGSAGTPSGGAASPATGSMSAAQTASAGANPLGAYARAGKTSAAGKLPRWAIPGGVAVAALAAVLVFTLSPKRSPQTLSSPQTPSAPGQSAPPIVASPGPPLGPANVPPAPIEARSPAAQPPATKNKVNAAKPAKAAASASAPTVTADAPPPPPADETHSGRVNFTSAEINSILAHADRDSGNGNFDKAIQEYKVVLSHEPSNELAKRGLQRALYNKEHK